MTENKQAPQSTWMLVDFFLIQQAACLWVEVDPAKTDLERSAGERSEVTAAEMMLVGAVSSGDLPQISPSHVSRQDLIAWAQTKNETPRFLFDTLMPFSDKKNVADIPVAKNKGGRPTTYDWNAFVIEIIRIAEDEQLPETGPELTQRMLNWFSETYGKEPTQRLVSERITNIYKALRPNQ